MSAQQASAETALKEELRCIYETEWQVSSALDVAALLPGAVRKVRMLQPRPWQPHGQHLLVWRNANQLAAQNQV